MGSCRFYYIRMFEFAEKFYAESLNEPRSPCLVITGQPGIGELFLMLLTLCITDISDTAVSRQISLALVCLCECAVRKKKPVILYLNGTCWLFVEEGVFKQPTDFYSGYYKIVIWTLVDSVDGDDWGPPRRLISHGTRHFVLYTTLLGWDKIHQSMRRAVCVMNPWTKAEILSVSLQKTDIT